MLHFDDELLKLSETRSTEMAAYGHIRYEGKPHYRTDGTPWTSVLEDLPKDYAATGFGENILAYSVRSNPYQLVSEQWMAKKIFEQWKSSKPHYANMMDPDYNRTAVALKLATRYGTRSDNETNWMVATQILAG